jgi:hypothetical protein
MVCLAAGGVTELSGGALSLELVTAMSAGSDKQATVIVELCANFGGNYVDVGCRSSSAL